MLHNRISKKFKVGDKVVLLTGSKLYKGKTYTIKTINNDKVTLDGYQTRKRAKKITQENTENYSTVDLPIHISNIALATEDGKPSKVAFKVIDEKKVRVLKKTNKQI
jgi:large subunit ribosomal protein L24